MRLLHEPARGRVALGGTATRVMRSIVAAIATTVAASLAYLYLHRGITHSVVLLPLWALLLSWLLAKILREGAE